MKLKIKEFNELAKKKGYHSGNNAFGPLVMLQVIDLEGETLQSFKSKYISIGGALY